MSKTLKELMEEAPGLRELIDMFEREYRAQSAAEWLMQREEMLRAQAAQQAWYTYRAYGFAAPPAPPADDPYVVLGLPRSATQREISKRYRQLAREYHPDVEGGDAAKMTQINNAYNALKGETT